MSIITGRRLNYFYNKIKDLFADKSIYGDGFIAVGVAEGTTLGSNSISVGNGNHANSSATVAIGGANNTASNPASVVIGGANNTAAQPYSCAIAGIGCTALSYQMITGHYNDISKATKGTNSGVDAGTAFCIGNGTSSTPSNAIRVDYNGKLWCKAAYSATGADYAELFEWADGNPNDEDRRGYFVTMDGNKIRKAKSGDWLLGVVSANPCVLGNTDTEWQGQFLKDEFGAYLIEDFTEIQKHMELRPKLDKNGLTVIDTNGEPIMEEVEVEEEVRGTKYVLNSEYDPDMEYTDRISRPEWDAVGMMGVLAVFDDGTCKVNGYCACNDDGIATASETGYRVISRIADNIVKIVFR